MRQSLDAFSTIETEAQTLVDLMHMAEKLSSLLPSMGLPHGVPQLCCDNKGAIALTQGEELGGRRHSCIGTTKMSADILTKILGPNPTHDALKSLGVAPFHQENGSSLP